MKRRDVSDPASWYAKAQGTRHRIVRGMSIGCTSEKSRERGWIATSGRFGPPVDL